MNELSTLANRLAEKGKESGNGFPFEVNPIPGEVEVLQIVIEDREELPIFISVSEEQILCMSYLFKQDEIKSGKENEINKAMLIANISMPLSAFSLIDDQYVIYGSLSVNSSLDDITHEIEILSDNILESIEAMREYLN